MHAIRTADNNKFIMIFNFFVVNPRLSFSPPLCSLWEKTCLGSVSVLLAYSLFPL